MVDFRGKQDCDVDHVLCLVAQLCLMLCDPRDCSPPGSSVHGIYQARILEWVVMPFSRGSSQPRDRTCVPVVPALQADSLPAEPQGKPVNSGATGDAVSIPGLGRSPGGGNGNSLQYSCLENPMDRGALWAMVHGATKSWT